jgi:hypothetical protein
VAAVLDLMHAANGLFAFTTDNGEHQCVTCAGGLVRQTVVGLFAAGVLAGLVAFGVGMPHLSAATACHDCMKASAAGCAVHVVFVQVGALSAQVTGSMPIIHAASAAERINQSPFLMSG